MPETWPLVRYTGHDTSADMLGRNRPGVVEAFADGGPVVAAILGMAPAVQVSVNFNQRRVSKN